jgi:RNA polymerase sigma-70 factor (ECF subfamily)
MPPPPEFESVVERNYRDLYQFALSLTRNVADASDLVQETFLIWATKGSQLQALDREKSWLFTTLHREFLQARRHALRFPEEELSEAHEELEVSPPAPSGLDSETVLRLVSELDERFRGPLALYYLEDFSYAEIADILQIPLGTVQSRIARGKARLLEQLRAPAHPEPLNSPAP